MATEIIKVPDLGDAGDVEVIEIPVTVGESVAENDSLVVLESDKAAMEVPAPMAGVVKSIAVNLGDQVTTGAAILTLEVVEDATAAIEAAPAAAAPENPPGDSQATPESADPGSGDSAQTPEQPPEQTPEQASATDSSSSPAAESALIEVAIPDIGSDDEVDIIEIHVSEGQTIAAEDPLLTLESDKAAMDVPSPAAGVVESLLVEVGAKVRSGTAVLRLRLAASQTDAASSPADTAESSPAATPESAAPASLSASQAASAPGSAASAQSSQSTQATPAAAQPAGTNVYAGPAVRKLARELGVDLSRIQGSGARGRIVKEDVHEFVKTSLAAPQAGAATVSAVPDIDFSRFGEIEQAPRSKLARVTAVNMQRSWQAVPHVAQFEEADVTELEAFRAGLKPEAQRRGVKLTPLPFLLKACAQCLRELPQFNVSLHSSGEYAIQKKYVHIGVAVATEAGLLVPVIRDVDQKNLWQLAEEVATASERARDRKLTPEDMQGACFTISSLGAIGGTGFIPIVNAPEVAILGVARTAIKPIWNGSEFAPRTMLPLTLTYDHKALNGADGGQFTTRLATLLNDIRHLLL